MRFELSGDMIGALKAGAGLSFGSDHENYREQTQVGAQTRASLLADLDQA